MQYSRKAPIGEETALAVGRMNGLDCATRIAPIAPTGYGCSGNQVSVFMSSPPFGFQLALAQCHSNGEPSLDTVHVRPMKRASPAERQLRVVREVATLHRQFTVGR